MPCFARLLGNLKLSALSSLIRFLAPVIAMNLFPPSCLRISCAIWLMSSVLLCPYKDQSKLNRAVVKIFFNQYPQYLQVGSLQERSFIFCSSLSFSTASVSASHVICQNAANRLRSS